MTTFKQTYVVDEDRLNAALARLDALAGEPDATDDLPDSDDEENTTAVFFGESPTQGEDSS